MPITKVADVIRNPIYRSAMIEASAEKSAFFASGIIQTVNDLAIGERLADKIGMPFWKEFREQSQVLDDTTDLQPQKLTTGQDEAVIIGRALTPSITDLAVAVMGNDPVAGLAGDMGAAWASDMQTDLLAVLKGAFGALGGEATPVNVLDISAATGGAANLDSSSFVDATGRLGDQAARLTGIAVHSATMRSMVKQDLIDFENDSEGRPTIRTYLGRTVIEDDRMPNPNNGNPADTYTSYIFGPGAIGYAEGTPKVPEETERDALRNSGDEVLVSRRHFVMHPRGVKWTGANKAKQTPSNAELADAANWQRVYDSKNVRMVAFTHKLAA